MLLHLSVPIIFKIYNFYYLKIIKGNKYVFILVIILCKKKIYMLKRVIYTISIFINIFNFIKIIKILTIT